MEKNFSKGMTFSRVVLTVLCVTLGILLALMVTVTAYAGFFSQSGQTEAPETAHPSEVPVETVDMHAEKLAAAVTQSRPADLLNDWQDSFGGGEIINLLLVGKDADGDTGTRSDTMILCSFNKKDQTITMTSFLRDLYVKIPGHQKDRINASYNFGGIELLEQTICENFGVQIDGNIQVDFECFEKIIDLLGGVTLELTEAEASYINRRVRQSDLSAGEQLLTGKQALAYARNRHDKDGDFSRTNRQRKLLTAIIAAYKDQKMTRMLSLVKEIAPMVKTDISKADMTGYAMTLFPMLSSARIHTQAIPVAGGYYDAKIDGKAVLVPDLEKNIQALECAIE